MKNMLFILLLIAFATIGVQLYTENELRQENERYAANQTALLDSVRHYKTENGRNAASVEMLTLSCDELMKYYDEMAATAAELRIKLKRVQSASATGTETDVKVVTVVKDSIVYRDSHLDTLRMFNWKDPWIDVRGEIERDSVALDICARDTLTQIVHRVPKKFWFIKYGTKAIRQEIVSSNPHTKITYTEYIELK